MSVKQARSYLMAALAAGACIIGLAHAMDYDRAAGMIGLVTTAMVIAPMVSPLIGGILDTAFGWEAIFLFITVMSGAVLAWAVLTLPETHHTRVSSTPAALWSRNL